MNSASSLKLCISRCLICHNFLTCQEMVSTLQRKCLIFPGHFAPRSFFQDAVSCAVPASPLLLIRWSQLRTISVNFQIVRCCCPASFLHRIGPHHHHSSGRHGEIQLTVLVSSYRGTGLSRLFHIVSSINFISYRQQLPHVMSNLICSSSSINANASVYISSFASVN